MVKKMKVAVIYHYIAHYRKPVFDVLCDSCPNEYYVVADETSNINSLSTLSSDEKSCGKVISSRWIKVKNLWISKNILWQRGIIKIALSKKFDVLIMLGNMYFISTWVAAILAKASGKKVYFWTHGYLRNETGLKSSIRDIFYKMSNGLLLYGHNAKSILIEKGFSKKNLHVIYNSLDYSLQSKLILSIEKEYKNSVQRSLGLADGDSVVIASGRLTQPKRFDLLVDMIKLLNNDGQINCKLLIIGDGPEKANLVNHAEFHGVADSIIFYGACYDEKELSVLFCLSDVCVVPGDIGLSAIHSLTYGVPVVTHDDFVTHKPEYEAIKNNINGSFYRAGSLSDLVVQVRKWLSNDKSTIFDLCREPIESFYNPHYQALAIQKIIEADSYYD